MPSRPPHDCARPRERTGSGRLAQPIDNRRVHPADQMERLASQLHMLAFDMREPSRTFDRSERLIAEGERIADEVRALVRGRC